MKNIAFKTASTKRCTECNKARLCKNNDRMCTFFHFFFFFAIAGLKNYSWCNVFQHIKNPSLTIILSKTNWAIQGTNWNLILYSPELVISLSGNLPSSC